MDGVGRAQLEERAAEEHGKLDLGILVVALALVHVVVVVVPAVVDMDQAPARADVYAEHGFAVELVLLGHRPVRLPQSISDTAHVALGQV